MPASPNPSVSPLDPDLVHKLGFCQSRYTNQDRREDIKVSMRDLKRWLDNADDEEVEPAKVETRPRVDSLIGRPVVLIASTGSIRKKKMQMQVETLAVPNPSERRDVTEKSEGFVSFPALAESAECLICEEKKGKSGRVGAKNQDGIVSRLRRLFEGLV